MIDCQIRKNPIFDIVRRGLQIFIACVLFSAVSVAQVAEIDSLDGLLNTKYKEQGNPSDTARVRVLVDLAKLSIRVDPDRSLDYSKEALRLSIRKGFKQYLADIYNATGTVYRLKGNYQRSEEFHTKALEFDQKRNFRKGMALSLNNLGNLDYSQGNLDRAIQRYSRSLSIRQDINDMKGVASSLNNLGLVYKVQGDYDRALAYYQNALEIFSRIDDKVGIANAHNNMGIIYRKQGNLELALENLTSAHAVFDELGNKVGLALAMNNIGNVFFMQGDHDKALEFFNSSLETSEEIGDIPATANKLMNIGGFYATVGDPEKALELNNKALKIQNEIGDTEGQVNSLKNIGSVYHDQLKDNDKALEYLLRSLSAATRMRQSDNATNTLYTIGSIYKEQGKMGEAADYLERSLKAAKRTSSVKDIQMAYSTLSELYADLGDFKTSYDYQKANELLQDSLDKVVNQRDLAEMQTRFETIAQERELELMNKEREVQDQVLKRQKLLKNFLIAVAILVLLMALLIYSRYRTKQKANEDLDRKNKEIASQKNVVEEKNEEITSSIAYAKRIQDAILPTLDEIGKTLPNSFIFYKPKAIVSGDFYWHATLGNKVFVAAVDCTGHGVPGAFMSMIGNDLLNQIVNIERKDSPDVILNNLHKDVQIALKQKHGVSENHDGMDIALVAIDLEKELLEFASANRYLYLYSNGELREFKGDHLNIGGIMHEDSRNYAMETAKLKKGDMIYLFSDGITDQFGGAKGKKFGYKQLKEKLGELCSEPVAEQKKQFEKTMSEWMTDQDQIDDFLLIGIRF